MISAQPFKLPDLATPIPVDATGAIIKQSIPWTLAFDNLQLQLRALFNSQKMRRSVLDFNWVGDSITTPKTDNIKGAIDAADWLKNNLGGVLEIPPQPGSYYIGDQWLLDSLTGCEIVGVLKSFDFAAGYQPGTLLFNGAAHGIKIIDGRCLNIRNLAVNGNSVTDRLVDVDRLVESSWDSVSGVSAANTAFRMRDTTGTAAVQFNKFGNLNAENSPTCLELSGTATSGVYHCDFNNSRFGYSANGIDLLNCDNVYFSGTTHTYRQSGAGYAARWVDNGLGNFPGSIGFDHLEPTCAAGTVTIHFDANCNYPGDIFLDLSNGGVMPAIPSGCSVTIRTAGLNSKGYYFSQVFPGTPDGRTQTGVAWSACSGVPDNAWGLDNFWCASDNGHLYFKAAGAWGVKV